MRVIDFITLILDSFSSLTLYQTLLITATLAGAQMIAATNRPKKPVTLVLLNFVHLLSMVVAHHAQEMKQSVDISTILLLHCCEWKSYTSIYSYLNLTFSCSLSDLDNNNVGNQRTKETCDNYNNFDNPITTCALIADGDCPCPETEYQVQVRCYNTSGFL